MVNRMNPAMLLLLLYLGFPLHFSVTAAEAAGPELERLQGSWVHLDSSDWKNSRVYTFREDGTALYLVSRTDDNGYLSFRMYEGRISEAYGQLLFSGEHMYQLTEDEGGFSQADASAEDFGQLLQLEFLSTPQLPEDAASGGMQPDEETDRMVIMNGESYQRAFCCFESICSCPQNIAVAFIPFVNITIYAAQSKLSGFGTSDMLDYWENPVTISGLQGSVTVQMRSSGKVMFFFPKLPVWVDFIFEDFSVVEGISISGTQSTFSRNKNGDGYLYGSLDIEGFGSLSYGNSSGEDSIIIEDGSISSGFYTVEVNGRLHRVPVD